ncbi:MAG: ferrous iron transport protein B [Prevotella sp.]|jgi:ferrous iron transport protein B
MTLKELQIGQTATVTSVGGEGALRQHILDLGLIPGVDVKLVKFAPMGDPMELLIHGYELTLRLADAAKIEVTLSDKKGTETHIREHDAHYAYEHQGNEHPGLGEMHPLHVTKGEHDHVVNEKLSFALVGNQNCGKTTLFNQLTGMNQHVGNFPGVTIDQKTGTIRNHPEATVTDLPGIYSLSPYSQEEVVSRQFILTQKPTGIINIVDASNIERNLYLTMQLMELGIPMVIALNMMDEVKNNGGTILVNILEQRLGVPVVPISALRNEGVEELVEHAVHVAKYDERPTIKDFCSPDDHGGAVHRAIHATLSLIEDHAQRTGIPARFAASKLLEGDSLVAETLQLDDNEKHTVEHIRRQMEQERGLDPSAAIADMRYSFILKVCSDTVVKPSESKEHARSRKIDRVLTGKWTAIPTFILIMAVIFYLTFDILGGTLQDLMEEAVEWFTGVTDEALNAWHVSPVIHSLITEGIYPGVGTVISFLPIIVILFFFLSILEDSGYMARVAFFMDRSMRRLGLSGRSIVPLLMGFGCSVPSIMASRTLPSERDRRMTAMLTPFMSCTAKLPIYGFLVAAFFPSHGGLVMTSLYLFAILVGIVVALFLKKFIFTGEPVPFVLELPNYRMPGASSVMRLIWEKTKDFIQRAFSVIFVATIVIWFLQSFDWGMNMVSDSQHSMLASIAGLVAPIFNPLGFGSWKVVSALITGFMAKESVVATLTVLFGSSAGLHAVLTTATAASLLVFCLLYTPCVATIATVKREMGGAFALGMVFWQTGIAWIVAFLVYHIVTLII